MLFVSITLATAQEKTFIVNKNFQKTITLVSDFQSKLMKDEGGFDAAMGDNSFKTDLIIRNEKYTAGTTNNYLLLQRKEDNQAEVILSTIWDVTIEKVDANKSKVILTLTKINPEDGAAVDLDKTSSAGKLEKQLKTYINSKK